MSLHMEVCWQPNISLSSSTRINRWSRFASNGWGASLRCIKEKTLATLVAVRESKRASQERGCCCERVVREHTRTPQPSEKRGRRRRGESVQISKFWSVCLQDGVWRLKRAWIGSKLGELVTYFEYFIPVTQFGIWVNGGSVLRAVLSGRTAAISAQSSFGRRTVWVGKRCPIELIFGQYVGNSYVYLSTKFRAVWISGLRAVRWLLKRAETVISLSLLYLTSCDCCCCCRWATRRSVL
jgi:hypothetical protein